MFHTNCQKKSSTSGTRTTLQSDNMSAFDEVELYPVDGRKSFYGKAAEYEDIDGNYWLRSYNTIVAKIIDGELFVRGEYSYTTNRHVYSFAYKHCIDCSNIKQMRKRIGLIDDKEFDMLAVRAKEWRAKYGA